MTSLETTIEIPQIASLADVPTEFWIAASIQILILVFTIWAVSKLIKLAFKILSPKAEFDPASDTQPKVTKSTADFERETVISSFRAGVVAVLLAVFWPDNIDPLGKYICLILSPVFIVFAAFAWGHSGRRIIAAQPVPSSDTNPSPSIDDDFADIIEEMEKERNINA